MNDVAGEIDAIVSSLVSEAEAHFAERLTQPGRTAFRGPVTSTWQESHTRADPDSTATGSSSGVGADDTVQQRLSTNSSQESEASDQNKSPVTAAKLSRSTLARQATELQQPRQQQLDTSPVEASPAKTDVPESVAKNSKLLALKQRRLGSLSSSLDLSRESSFDSALHHALHEAASTSENSFARTVAHGSSSAMQADTELNEQASVSLAPLPLDSTTGTPEDLGCLYLHL